MRVRDLQTDAIVDLDGITLVNDRIFVRWKYHYDESDGSKSWRYASAYFETLTELCERFEDERIEVNKPMSYEEFANSFGRYPEECA